MLFVPLKKRHRTNLMIKKFTEIGAGRIMPIASDWMQGNASHDNDGDNGGGVIGDGRAQLEDKLGLILIDVSEQCKRLDVPVIARSTALPSGDNNGGSPLPPSRGGGLWTVPTFLPRWCRDWEGGGRHWRRRNRQSSKGGCQGDEGAPDLQVQGAWRLRPGRQRRGAHAVGTA